MQFCLNSTYYSFKYFDFFLPDLVRQSFYNNSIEFCFSLKIYFNDLNELLLISNGKILIYFKIVLLS